MKLIRKNRKKGFTLVELIVVIAILAILALILIPAITGYIAKAEDSRGEASARALYSKAVLLASGTDEDGHAWTESSLAEALEDDIDKGKDKTVTVDLDEDSGQVTSVTLKTQKDREYTAP